MHTMSEGRKETGEAFCALCHLWANSDSRALGMSFNFNAAAGQRPARLLVNVSLCSPKFFRKLQYLPALLRPQAPFPPSV